MDHHMTKTPLEEFLDDMGRLAQIRIMSFPESLLEPENRSELIKRLWQEAIISAPPGALDGGEGIILELDDFTGTTIRYEIKQYGDRQVVEAEGVVVCHLIV